MASSKGSSIFINSKKNDIFEIKKVKTTGQYSTKEFNDELLGKIIPFGEYEKIIGKLNEILFQSEQYKKKNDIVKLDKKYYYMSYLAFAFGIGYIIALFFVSRAKNNKIYIILSTICLLISTSIIFAISFYNFFRKIKEFQSLNVVVQEMMEDYLTELNKLSTNIRKEGAQKIVFKYLPESGGKIQIIISKSKDFWTANQNMSIRTEELEKLNNNINNENNSVRSDKQLLKS